MQPAADLSRLTRLKVGNQVTRIGVRARNMLRKAVHFGRSAVRCPVSLPQILRYLSGFEARPHCRKLREQLMPGTDECELLRQSERT